MLAVLAQGADPDHELAEVEELARTAGVEPIGRVVQHRSRPAQRTYVGKGKLEELRERFRDADAESILVDDELDPAQQRYLEDALGARVIDRTQLILDIFAQHAVTAEGKLQVELAQLEYNLPRMRGMWQHLERLGGGVGTRGPGESQLETDRRLARRRVSVLKGRLSEIERQRATRRKERRRTEVPTVALAGYTNVGKSTLLNALTGASVSVENRLFETLDPTTRGYEHAGRRYLVTDTVGFIRRLPHQLVEGFAATLEETLVADIVLHVADASAGDEALDAMIASVGEVLAEIGAGELPVQLVLNKIDGLDEMARRRLANRFPDAPQVSAATGEGLDELKDRIAVLVRVPLGAGAAAAPLRRGRPPVGVVRARCADRGARGHAGRRARRRAPAAAGAAAAVLGEAPMLVGIDRSVARHRRCRVVVEVVVAPPVGLGSDRAGAEPAATVRADVVEHLLDTASTEGALERTDHGVGGGRREGHGAVLTDRAKLQHVDGPFSTFNGTNHGYYSPGRSRCTTTWPSIRAEIEALNVEFWYRVDHQNGEGVAELFCEDGVYSVPGGRNAGRAAIAESYVLRRRAARGSRDTSTATCA